MEAIKPMCKATRRAGCDADLGGFGGLFDMAQVDQARLPEHDSIVQ